MRRLHRYGYIRGRSQGRRAQRTRCDAGETRAGEIGQAAGMQTAEAAVPQWLLHPRQLGARCKVCERVIRVRALRTGVNFCAPRCVVNIERMSKFVVCFTCVSCVFLQARGFTIAAFSSSFVPRAYVDDPPCSLPSRRELNLELAW